MSLDRRTSPRNATIPPEARALVSEDDAALMLSVSKPTLRKYASMGLIARVTMPEGTRRNLYLPSEIARFAASLSASGREAS